MVNFENGQLVKNAYVEINGVQYPVHEAQYEGNTPISEENLNKAQSDLKNEIANVDSKIKKELIVAQLTNTTYVGTSFVKLYMSTLKRKLGEKLQISDGGILIGAGVSKVDVSVILTPIVGESRGYTWLNILKNGIAIHQAFGTGISYVSSINIPALPIDVQEGDLITIQIAYEVYNSDNRIDVTKYNNTNYLKVEVVEES